MIYITCFIHLMYWEGVSVGIFTSEWVSVVLIEMPVIFYIAGASYALSSKKRYPQYVWLRIKRVVIPYWKYLLLCLPGILIVDYVRGRVFSSGDVLSFLFFDPRPMSHLFSHTWFILPYLIISLCMPFLFKCVSKYRVPFWPFYMPATLFLLCGHTCPELVKMVIAYMLFTVWGMYYGKKIKWQNIACVTLSGLYLIYALFVEKLPFNMQVNKFPPNLLFVAYCFLVMGAGGWCMRKAAVVLYDSFAMVRKHIDIYAREGYAIYLIHPFSVILLRALKQAVGLDALLSENMLLKIMYIPVSFLFLLYLNVFILRVLFRSQSVFFRLYHRFCFF